MIVRARAGATALAERPDAPTVQDATPGRHRAPAAGTGRRGFLATAGATGAAVAGGALLAGASPATADQTAAAPATIDTRGRLTWPSTAVPTGAERHLLSRFSYGFTATEFARLRARRGAGAWFEQQLRPETIADPVMDRIIAALPDMFLPPADLAASGSSMRKHPTYVAQEHLAATVARRVYSTRQLQAVMEDFWTNHFYIPCTTVSTIYYHADYTRALRDLALGRFADLLVAAEMHPAMLTYLSTVNSDESHPNENQARELFELHTVGRTGGYTEDTVGEVSRLLTGWTSDKWTVAYDPTRHATGTVSALTWSNPNSDPDGRAAFKDLLGYLAHHPSTARFVCHKLAVRFVCDDPTDAFVQRLATTYLNNDTQIAPVLRAIVGSPEFRQSTGQKLRTPAEDCIASLRAVGVTVPPMPTLGVDDHTSFLSLASLPQTAGQQLFAHQAPDGFPDVATAWTTSVRATAMLQWHWDLADPSSGLVGSDAQRPSVHSLMPRNRMRFDQWVDHLSRQILGVPADDRQVATACAATGLKITSVVTATSSVAGSGFQQLLVSLLDTPNLLAR